MHEEDRRGDKDGGGTGDEGGDDDVEEVVEEEEEDEEDLGKASEHAPRRPEALTDVGFDEAFTEAKPKDNRFIRGGEPDDGPRRERRILVELCGERERSKRPSSKLP